MRLVWAACDVGSLVPPFIMTFLPVELLCLFDCVNAHVTCVCEHMRLAGRRAGLLPLLISAVGQDAAGDLLLAQWQQLGLSTEATHTMPGLRTPSVSIIFDSGEQTLAQSDVLIRGYSPP